MAIEKGTMAAYGINTNVQRLDWDPTLADTFLKRNSFFSLIEKMGMGRHPTINHKHEWGEYSDAGVKLTITGGSADTLACAAGDADRISKDDILYCPTTNTNVYVNAQHADQAIAVTVDEISDDGNSLSGQLSADEYASGLVYYKTGTFIENAKANKLSELGYYKKIDNAYNYIQIFTDWVKIGKTVAAEEWQFQGMTRREHLRSVQMAHHVDKLEKTSWKGIRNIISSGTGRYSTRGFFNYGVQSKTGAYGAFDYNDFMDYCREKVMLNNEKDELDAFVNPRMMQKAAEWAKDTAEITFNGEGETDQFGLRIFRLVTPQVTLKLRHNRGLKDLYPSKAIMATVDLTKCGFVYLAGNGENNNTHMDYDVGPQYDDYYLDKIQTMLCFVLQNAENHSYLELS